ncbi:hypothetical protein [Streptomyces sp. ODS05-4]|uniref:hypothetical protein n=1 Tax=Streptomyces sp. ODS05-4 TaxID=2944939 RepID=UPI00210BCEE8|nr:hypothetical protein [Streptomyces sp. ODS05-4]
MADPLTEIVVHTAAHAVKHAAPHIDRALKNLGEKFWEFMEVNSDGDGPDAPLIHDFHPGS